MKKNNHFNVWNISIPPRYQLSVVLFFLLCTIEVKAQVGINSDNSNPDPSAMLDIKSTDRGMLVPRMNSTERTSISNPATGLLVYDNTSNSFWFYNGSAWEDLSATSTIDHITDADNDTKIQVEESVDEDKIRFDVAGTEVLTIDNSGNVGINTDNPDGKLEVVGSATNAKLKFGGPGVDAHHLSSARDMVFNSAITGDTVAFFLRSAPYNSLSTYTDLLSVTGNGKVGIGTSAPNYLLEVKGGDVSFDRNYELKFMRDDNTSSAYITPHHEGMTLWENRGGEVTKLTIWDDIHFWTNDTERMRIKLNGNVGIGTADPRGRLDIGDTTSAADIWGVDKIIGFDSLRIFADNAGTTEVARFTSDKMLGINTTNPRGRLDIAPDNGSGDIWGVKRINGTTNIEFNANNGNLPIMELGANGSTNIHGNVQIGSFSSTGYFIDMRSQGSNNRTQGINMLHFDEDEGFRLYSLDNNNIAPETGFYIERRTYPTVETVLFINREKGNITIGSDQVATRAKVEIIGSDESTLNYGWLNSSGNTGTGNTTTNYGLYAEEHIAAFAFHAHSDERIKNSKGQSDSKQDLNTLMDIEITDYTMVDSITNGHQQFKKVIAQDVAKVYPQAVTTDLTEVVPDIYQRAAIKDGWIMLSTDLQTGERVKLITESEAKIYEVIEAENDRFRVQLSDQSIESEKVFVYGREVDDFHTVDYEAISMLNVSATQELAKQIELLKAENKALKATNAAFESRFARLEATLQNEQVRETSSSLIIQTK